MAIEKELKYALSAKSYADLIHRFDPEQKLGRCLANTYFDDAKASLRRRGFGFRIRFIGKAEAVMALKYDDDAGIKYPRGFKSRVEIEAALPVAKAKQLVKLGGLGKSALAPAKALAARVPSEILKGVHAVGTLLTVRTKVKFKGLTLEIDSCEVFGKKFYELEVETKSPARADKIVRALLKEHGQNVRPLDRSKLARFWSEYRKQS